MKTTDRSLIEGLSYALDVSEKAYFSHSKHVAYLAILIGKELELPTRELKSLYFVSLLHDIGAEEAYSIDTHESGFIVRHCEVGHDIMLELPLKKELAEVIYYHHEHYDGTGPFKKVGDEIPLFSQIICLSNAFDLRFGKTPFVDFDVMETFLKWIDKTSRFYDPKIVNAFKKIIQTESVVYDYFNHEFNSIIANKVEIESKELGFESIKIFCTVISKIVDHRSPFTYRHSMGIADLASRVTTALGFDEVTSQKMYIAALLHDVGKLVVPNEIIEKPDRLDDKEHFEINKHTYCTRWVLKQIKGFEEITEYASNHHEKLNGKGYPQQLKAHQIGELDRVMAICDIYQALTEDRPYRDPMPMEKVWAIINSMVEANELDGVLVEKIKAFLTEENNSKLA